jgi:glutathione S-transferase
MSSPPPPRPRDMSDDLPTLFVCHGDDEGPKFHPCRRVQEALRAAEIPYNKVIAGHGHPIPFLRKGSRQVVVEATGSDRLPALRLPDGRVVIHSKAILGWVEEVSPRS